MNISKECSNYIVQSMVLLGILVFCGVLAMMLWTLDLTADIVASGCFVLVFDVATSLIFRWVAVRHADMLPTLITGVSGFRFLAALVLMAIWFVWSDRGAMGQFLVVFGIFYLLSLMHHSIFFSRLLNRL